MLSDHTSSRTVTEPKVDKVAKPARVEAGIARPDAPPLTERQEARRRRILPASAQLASRGGVHGGQRRGGAEASQVALGTLYRDFPSQIHLLAAPMQGPPG